MRKLVVPLCALVLALASCSGSGGGGAGTRASSTPSTAQTFAEADLATIALQEDQAPDGVPYCEECSGELSLEDLAEDEEERAKFGEYGYESGHGTAFASEGVLEAQDIESAPEKGAFVLSVVSLVKDAASAVKLRDYLAEQTREEGTNMAEFDADEVAGDAIGLEGQMKDFPYPGRIVIWTKGNLVLVITAAQAGRSDLDVIDLAQQMNDNAAA